MSAAAQEEVATAGAAASSNGHHSRDAASAGRQASPAKQSVSSPERARSSSPVKPDDKPRSGLSRAEKLLLDLDAEIERDRRHQRGGSASASPTPPPPQSGLGGSKTNSRVDVRTVSRALEEDAAIHHTEASRKSIEKQQQQQKQLLPDQQQLQRRVDDLLEENRRLQASLSRATASGGSSDPGTSAYGDRPRLDSDESQHLLDRLLLDKETMATEMQLLRSEIESLKSRDRTENALAKQQQQQQHPGLPEYDPNNPAALKRRIVDLEQQISDLQEANETMRQSYAVNQTPHQHQQQQQQQQQQVGLGLPSWSPASDSRLRATVEELTVENRVLRDEVTRLRQKERPDFSHLREEVGGLRSEMDSLREKNSQLVQENRRLLGSVSSGDSMTLSGYHHRPLMYDGVINSVGAISSGRQNQQSQPHFEARSYQRYEQPFEMSASTTLDRQSRSRSPTRQSLSQHRQQQQQQQQQQQKQAFFDASIETAQKSATWKKRHPAVPPLALSGAAAPAGNGTAAAAKAAAIRADDSGDSTDTILTDVEREFEGFDSGKAGYRSKYSREISPVRQSAAGKDKQQQFHIGSRHGRSSSSLAVDRSGVMILPPPASPLSPPITPPSPPPRRHHQFPSDSPFSTVGRHPFAPKHHADIRSGDLVKFTRQGGRISKGLVHYIGRLPGRNDVYIGVELDHEEGKHDGVYDGRRYFQCKPHKGVFVAFNKLIMCYQSK